MNKDATYISKMLFIFTKKQFMHIHNMREDITNIL